MAIVLAHTLGNKHSLSSQFFCVMSKQVILLRPSYVKGNEQVLSPDKNSENIGTSPIQVEVWYFRMRYSLTQIKLDSTWSRDDLWLANPERWKS